MWTKEKPLDPKTNPANKKHKCEFCGKDISWSVLKTHSKVCYLNPINLKLCSICNIPIKNYRHLDICSGHRKLKYSLQKRDSCKFCGKEFTVSNTKIHEKYCFMNPINIRKCPNCNEILKTRSKTCSIECLKELRGNKSQSHKSICFRHHKKECAICKEDKVLDVHHFDENHENNNPENLVPLCPTHHRYMHSRYKNIIVNYVNTYVNNFKNIERKKNEN